MKNKKLLILPLISFLIVSCSPSSTSPKSTYNDSTKPTAVVTSDAISSNTAKEKAEVGASAKDSTTPTTTTTTTTTPTSPVASTAPTSTSPASSGAAARIDEGSSSGSSSGSSTSGSYASEDKNAVTSGGISNAPTAYIPPQPVKALSGGSTDDNDKFLDYIDYVRRMNSGFSDFRDVIKVDTSERYTINLTDKNGKPVNDANVTISSDSLELFTAKSYSNGKVLFFPKSLAQINKDCQQMDCSQKFPNNLKSYRVTVLKDNLKMTKDFDNTTTNWNIKTDNVKDQQTGITLDLTFLVDATGSMGDEIASIQKTIKDVSTKIQNLSPKPEKIRYSLVSFRDRGDIYRVKRYDFTTNLGFFQDSLNELAAGGGGDYPESVNEGLDQAINKVTWTDNNAIRLVFLVGDAPPHLDYADDYRYNLSMADAVKKGVKIYPLGASGLDSKGEYVFRQLAQYTSSKFLFITYGGDAQTPGTTTAQVGAFKENNLDSLIVDVVKEELSNLQF
ncbi:MAG: vWA domain-containing protein [Cyanobacteriota bacterium]